MEVRHGTVDDARSISALAVDVHNLHVAAQPDFFKPVTGEDWAVPAIIERMADPQSHYYVASIDGQDAGYVYAHLRERPENLWCFKSRTLYIEEISVRPALQRRGCGEALVAAACDLGRELGVDHVSLDHWEFNRAAHEFFAKQGFVTRGEQMWLKP
jgi:ribosomal protein S18 acetylase RimI-like enzyme